MSVPVTIDLPIGFRRVALPGRLGPIAAVCGAPAHPVGSALLIPGFTGSKEDYFAILPDLLHRGWAVTAIDLPGMFESAGTDQPDDFTLQLLVADVADLIPLVCPDAAVHLVGHSAGGLIARHVAVEHTAALASLTLYDSGCGRLTDEARTNAELLRTLLATTGPAQVHQLKVALDKAAGRPLPPLRTQQFLAHRWQRTTSGHLIGMAGIALNAADLVDELAALSGEGRLPLLALYGEHDDNTWRQTDFAHLASRAASRTVVVPNAEHSPAVENPTFMAAALDSFWRDLP